jgi:hypothetical protein
MSKPAWLFLCLILMTASLGLGITCERLKITAFIASAVFGSLLMLTLILGRKIKFDPIFR